MMPLQEDHEAIPGFRGGFLAIVSDIHGCLAALEAVLEDIARWPVGGIVCLGDTVGYGDEPERCVELVRGVAAVHLLGNHEALLAVAPGVLSPWGQLARPTTGDGLPAATRDWLLRRPATWRHGGAEFCHGSLHEPHAFHYVDSAHEAARNFAAQTEFVSFHGHTHIPVIWQEGGRAKACTPGEEPVRLTRETRYAICVGSVGLSRDGDPRASYMLYDPEAGVLFPRRLRI